MVSLETRETERAAVSVFERNFEHSEALFKAALDAFVAHGYEQASLNAILDEAGMSKGQYYYYFRSKQELYLAIIGVLVTRKQAFLANTMRPEELEQDIFAVLRAQIRYGAAFARQYPDINRFAASFVREQGKPIYEKALARFDFRENETIGALIERAYRRGELRRDLPLPFVKKCVGYLFNHAAELIEPGADFEDEMAYLIAFMKGGLATATAAGQKEM